MSYEFFEQTPEIDKYINNKDFIALRGILVGIINRDPTFATKRFEETMDYICSNLDVWEYIPKKLPGEYELEEDKWDKEYFHKQLAWLSQNFTHERVKKIEKIGKNVYASENTWGKHEAENFYYPVTQKRKTENAKVGSGKILRALIIVIIMVVEIGLLKADINLITKITGIVIGIIAMVRLSSVFLKRKEKKKHMI